MSKKKANNTVAENTATVVNENQEVQKSTLENAPKTVVVGVYPGAMELVKKVFSKLPENVEVIYIEDQEGNLESLINLVAAAIADPGVTEEFVLIPCGTIPCDPSDLAALELSTVYVNRLGKKEYDSSLPLVVNTEKAIEILKEIEAQNIAPELLSEEFAERYIKANRPRPVEVSHYFGNYVTPIRRGDPCENVVIEAFLKKKFITAIRSGFKAVAPLVEEAFK